MNHLETEYAYQIGDPSITILLDGAQNGLEECGFNVRLTERGAKVPVSVDLLFPVFTFNDAQFTVDDPYRPNHKTLSKHAEVIVFTSELSLEGEYNLTMTISDLWGADPENDPTCDIKIWVHRANPCQGGFRNFPIGPASFYEYQIGQKDPLVIPIAGIDNTQCDFDIELYDGLQASVITHNAFNLTQPVLEPEDSQIKTAVFSDGYITVDSTDERLAGKNHTINVRLVSKKYIMRKST